MSDESIEDADFQATMRMIFRDIAAQPEPEAGRRADENSEILEDFAIVSPPALPCDAFPMPVRDFICGMAKAMGLPVEAQALPVLTVLAAAVGNSYILKVNPSWPEPCILRTVLIEESGDLKSPPFRHATKPFKVRQSKAEQRYLEQLADYDAAMLVHESAVSDFKKGKVTRDPPPAPQRPVPVEYFTADPTVEGMAAILANNPKGVPLVRDEGSGWLRSFNQYKGGKGGDDAFWLETYDGSVVKHNRVGKRIYVDHACVSVAITCQPKVFSSCIQADRKGGEDQIANGQAARLLVSMPSMPPKVWQDGTYPERIEKGYDNLVGRLLDLPVPTNADGGIEPKIVVLSPEARERFKRFVNEHNAEKSRIADTALRYHYAKLEGAAARIALVIHLCRWQCGEDVTDAELDLTSIEAGIALANWFKSEAHRVYGRLQESPAQQMRRELVELIRRKGGSITARELAKSSRRYHEAGAAEQALDDLVEQKLAAMDYQRAGGPGRPSVRYVLRKSGGVGGNEIQESPGNSGISPTLQDACESGDSGESKLTLEDLPTEGVV